MTTATAVSMRIAADAWGRARIYDDKLGDADAARITLWAESIDRWQLVASDVLGGVTSYYEAERAGRTIGVGDLIHHAREIRRDRAERDKAPGQGGWDAAPNPALGGLPIPTEGKPVWSAYEVNDAILRPCPRCAARPEEACLNPITKRALKIPCLPRLRADHPTTEETR